MTPFSTDESARISHDYTGVIILKSVVFGLIKLSFLDTEKNISDDFQKGNSFGFVKWSKLQFPKECMTEQINIL